ncbi:MAG TPA: heavy metal-responsive transcriptional regulator [Pyrinomonadaceae bacterium]|nr:heavy metal-responsive transcriptional regulator [Pyrinomonadaceae bacterium]
MRIGEVAANAGVNVQTVRYYERRGLLPKPSRLPSGYRVYQVATPGLIRFIKRAQALGFTLRELKDLLRVTDQPLGSSIHLRSIAKTKINSIDEEIRRLTEAREFLSELLTKCGCLDPGHGCIIRIPQ